MESGSQFGEDMSIGDSSVCSWMGSSSKSGKEVVDIVDGVSRISNVEEGVAEGVAVTDANGC